MKIAPSILSMDFSNFNNQLDILNSNVEYIHFDVMDGHFVPNISFGPSILEMFNRSSDLIMDVHLMISNPEKYIEKFVKVGADIITFHFEALDNDINKSLELINKIHSLNIKAGLSIKPNTNVELIKPLLNVLDLVLVMSVEPGFGGQSFINDSLIKIRYLSKYKIDNKYKFIIEVDGGINEKTASLCKEAGADLLVAGSFIFTDDILDRINTLKKI